MPRVLKAPPAAATTELTRFAFDDLCDSTADPLSAARKQAERIVADAEREANAIRQAAEVAGRNAGLEAIESLVAERVAAQAERLLPALRQAIDGVETAKAECVARWE